MLNQVEGKDVICPECCRPVAGAAVLAVKDDRYHRKTRSYLGHCVRCRESFEVIQYYDEINDRWKMQMFRYYVGSGGGRNIGMPWKVIEDLPEPEAAIVIGPGGDYDQEVKIEPIDFVERAQRVLEAAAETMGQAVKAVGDLAKVLRVSKNLNHEDHEGHEDK